MYTAKSVKCQGLLPSIQNTRGVTYVGAWTQVSFDASLRLTFFETLADHPLPQIFLLFSSVRLPRRFDSLPSLRLFHFVPSSLVLTDASFLFPSPPKQTASPPPSELSPPISELELPSPSDQLLVPFLRQPSSPPLFSTSSKSLDRYSRSRSAWSRGR